jgi:tetratricopeptide (TPR) repeat protein
LFACVVGAASAQSAAAQPAANGQERVAVARALFEEGLSHVDAQRWALAADCFSRLLELKYSAVAQYNLALSQARLGNALRAVELLQALLTEPQLEPTVRKVAVDLFEEQRGEVAWLNVSIGGECDGCTVGVDDRRLPGEAQVEALTVPVAPGSHVLRLMRADTQLNSSQVDVSRGQRLDVELREDSTAPSAMVAAASVMEHDGASEANSLDASLDPSAPRDSGSGLLASPWFWGAVGVVAVGSIVLGIALASGDPAAASPVPGDFNPGVVAGVVDP